MSIPQCGPWTRRRLLRSVPAAFAAAFAPRLFARGPAPAAAKAGAPFSRFVDVAASAGLTEPMVYGDPAKATYIIEIMGGGCAFLDYDNDGWMDIFILCGRAL